MMFSFVKKTAKTMPTRFFLWGLPRAPRGVALFGVSAAFGGPAAPTIARPNQAPKTHQNLNHHA